MNNEYPIVVNTQTKCFAKYGRGLPWIHIQANLPKKPIMLHGFGPTPASDGFVQQPREYCVQQPREYYARDNIKTILGNVVVATICLSLAVVSVYLVIHVPEYPFLMFGCFTSTGIFSFISALHMLSARKAYDDYESTLN